MIFVDTSFWLALRLPRNAHHEAGQALLEQVAEQSLVTSNHVRGETWTLLRRHVGHPSAVHFLDHVERSPRVRIAFVSEELETRALRWLRQRAERSYSFVDATSFALMRALRIRAALTFDADFEAAGFEVLRV